MRVTPFHLPCFVVVHTIFSSTFIVSPLLHFGFLLGSSKFCQMCWVWAWTSSLTIWPPKHGLNKDTIDVLKGSGHRGALHHLELWFNNTSWTCLLKQSIITSFRMLVYPHIISPLFLLVLLEKDVFYWNSSLILVVRLLRSCHLPRKLLAFSVLNTSS